jgi:hypothetical protein
VVAPESFDDTKPPRFTAQIRFGLALHVGEGALVMANVDATGRTFAAGREVVSD